MLCYTLIKMRSEKIQINSPELTQAAVSLRQLIEQEQQKKAKGENYNAHFDNMNFSDLQEADVAIYHKFINNELTAENLDAHWVVLNDWLTQNNKDIYTDSRANLAAYLANLLTVKQLEKMNKESLEDTD